MVDHHARAEVVHFGPGPTTLQSVAARSYGLGRPVVVFVRDTARVSCLPIENLGELFPVLAGGTVGHGVRGGDRSGVLGVAVFDLLPVLGPLVVELFAQVVVLVDQGAMLLAGGVAFAFSAGRAARAASTWLRILVSAVAPASSAAATANDDVRQRHNSSLVQPFTRGPCAQRDPRRRQR
jgi:hypothetical protein